jgi:hypothetical protein
LQNLPLDSPLFKLQEKKLQILFKKKILMYTLAENNVEFEFLSLEIVKVSLGKTGTLSTPLIRELAVYSKVKNGIYAKAYIIDIKAIEDADESLWRVCRKAERFASDVLVAVVYPYNALQANLQNFRAMLKPKGRIQVFSTHEAALTWTNNKLHESDYTNHTNTLPILTERTA